MLRSADISAFSLIIKSILITKSHDFERTSESSDSEAFSSIIKLIQIDQSLERMLRSADINASPPEHIFSHKKNLRLVDEGQKIVQQKSLAYIRRRYNNLLGKNVFACV